MKRPGIIISIVAILWLLAGYITTFLNSRSIVQELYINANPSGRLGVIIGCIIVSMIALYFIYAAVKLPSNLKNILKIDQ